MYTAKSLQSWLTLCDPIDGCPPGSRPWDSPGMNTGVGYHFLLQCIKVKRESEVAQSCPTPSNPLDCSPPGSSIHGIFPQAYWSGVPLPSPWNHLGSIKHYWCLGPTSRGANFICLGYSLAIFFSPKLPRWFLGAAWATHYCPRSLICSEGFFCYH